jgi:hypothetical protein
MYIALYCNNFVTSTPSLLFQNRRYQQVILGKQRILFEATCPLDAVTTISQGSRAQRQNTEM